jgi:glycosyltransferase involved in cell wall biosynthesis
MRIGIDGSCLANRRGFGRFARESLAALARAPGGHDFVVFVDRPSEVIAAGSVPGSLERVTVDVGEAPSRAASASGRRRVRDMLAMGRAVARARLDLIYFPASYSFFPVWNVPRVIVTIHDTLPLVHPELVFPTWQGRVSWTLKEHAAVRWADGIVTVSEAARRDLIAWHRLPAGRVRVVSEAPDSQFQPLPPGPESDAVLVRYGIAPGQRYLLYLGGLSPHKNLLRLIEAFARTVETGVDGDMKLVLAGDLGDNFHTHVPELRTAVARWRLDNRVLFPGFIPDEDLVHVYNRAYALAQPSLLEGFGLPPVEAMACGVPVLYSRAGSLPEVVGDAGLDFDPTDVAAMAGALGRLLADPALRDGLGRRALQRARRFSWTATARGLLDCFDEFDPARARRISA